MRTGQSVSSAWDAGVTYGSTSCTPIPAIVSTASGAGIYYNGQTGGDSSAGPEWTAISWTQVYDCEWIGQERLAPAVLEQPAPKPPVDMFRGFKRIH
jgi:hypothetical protein